MDGIKAFMVKVSIDIEVALLVHFIEVYQQINVPNFFIGLFSPTSTNKYLQVTMKLSGNDGMIMKLNYPFDIDQCRYLR